MASSHLLRPLSAGAVARPGALPFPRFPFRTPPSLFPPPHPRGRRLPSLIGRARGKAAQENPVPQQSKDTKGSNQSAAAPAPVTSDEGEEVEEDLPWIQEKAMDLVEFTGTVTHAIPGPRVGQSPFPWLLTVPLAYVGISFVVAFVKTVRKITSPKAKRKRLVNKNAFLLKSIDDLLGNDEVTFAALKGLMQKTGFSMDDILRKYVRYALNEKPFNPDLVVDLIHLRKASILEDPQVAEVLNEISRRIVKEKGPVLMDISGFTEKGFQRKLAVQALFGKILYLSELPEFCARDSSLVIKEIFGVTDEDADTLRIRTLSEPSDVDSLKKMVDDSDTEDTATDVDSLEKTDDASDTEDATDD